MGHATILKKRDTMVTALVLLNLEHQHIQNVSQQLVDIQEVTEVY